MVARTWSRTVVRSLPDQSNGSTQPGVPTERPARLALGVRLGACHGHRVIVVDALGGHRSGSVVGHRRDDGRGMEAQQHLHREEEEAEEHRHRTDRADDAGAAFGRARGPGVETSVSVMADGCVGH